MNIVINLELSKNLVGNAEALFNSMGLDIQTAVKIFLTKSISMNALPFDLSATPTTQIQKSIIVEDEKPQIYTPKRQEGKITKEMAACIWDEFKKRRAVGNDNWNEAAKKISIATHMNSGSAFIYFYILNNLLEGKPNTRNMKLDDLKYYLDRILDEYSESAFQTALDSLEASLPYWDENLPGTFSEKVRELIEEIRNEEGTLDSALHESYSQTDFRRSSSYENVGSPKKEFLINGVPCNMNEFERFLQGQDCEVKVTLFYPERQEEKQWQVRNFSETSSLSNNLGSGFLRNWRANGIIGISLEV